LKLPQLRKLRLNKPIAGIESVILSLPIATLQERPQRCALAVEHEIFPEAVRQLLYGKAKNVYRILFTTRDDTVYVLYIRHSAQAPLTQNDMEESSTFREIA